MSSAGPNGPPRSRASSPSTGQGSRSASDSRSSSRACRSWSGRSPNVTPGASWTWVQRSPGGLTLASHEVIAESDRPHEGPSADRPARSGRRPGGVVHATDDAALPGDGGRGSEGQKRAASAPRWPDLLTSSGDKNCSTRSLRRSRFEASVTAHFAMSPPPSAPATECCCTTSALARRCCWRSSRRSSAANGPCCRNCRRTSRRRSQRCGPICAGPSCGPSSASSSSATPAASRASSRSPACCRGPSTRGSLTAGGTTDPALARLGLAVARGLLLDLVATR